ncbi:HxlR family transcriptional regulator [Fontibacillus phaseoli]|uniref:HxlR family transcriptional regulator n=1 Tax=Fontibacillus phaseoli TaxID=1416533 RepID=A0A369BMC2_9BACL|nr:helix-turn-helix domain-containing protein [Fontibacillus phaseoli]RCX21607.1 HxlR family transcriptional regulator [Fontibacillus phaseoli]
MKLRETYTCPLEMTHDIIRGKWKPIILWQLGKSGTSLAELEREIQGINQKMLLEHLKDLQDYGIVDKKSFEGYPRKVIYNLTERGKKLLEVVVIMQGIGVELMLESGMEYFLREQGLIS